MSADDMMCDIKYFLVENKETIVNKETHIKTNTMTDTNDKELKNGDIINLHQTVNGQHLFVVLNVDILDIRYSYDLTRKYEYDKAELLAPSKFNGLVEWEIVDNIYTMITELDIRYI